MNGLDKCLYAAIDRLLMFWLKPQLKLFRHDQITFNTKTRKNQ